VDSARREFSLPPRDGKVTAPMATGRKATWTKSSAELIALFAELVPKDPAVTQKKMFGWPCCFVSGNLSAGLHKENMIFRLSDADRIAFLRLDGAADFEPMPGRKMKGYAILTDPMGRDRKELSHWLERSLAFTRSLPAKNKAKRAGQKERKKSRMTWTGN
jgi:TfoX/Sxy family transcriptional regulator of competence genes